MSLRPSGHQGTSSVTIGRNTVAASGTTKSKFNKSALDKNLRHISINFLSNKIETEESCALQGNPMSYLIRWAQLFALISLMTNQPKNRIVRAILFGYTIIVFIALCLYCILLIVSIANEAPHEGHSSTVPFQRRFTFAFTLLGILLNVRLHSIETRDVSEITQCLSADSRIVNTKKYYLRGLCIASVCFCIAVPFIVLITKVFIRAQSDNIEPSSLLQCGIFCEIIDIHAFCISLLSLLVISSFFAIFAFSLYYESEDLIEQIKQCFGGSNVDYLIFRYQWIETSARLVERRFSILVLVVTASSISLQFFTFRELRHSYHPHAFALFYPITATVMLTLATLLFITGTALVNSQLVRFRSASHKIADLQHLQISNGNTVAYFLMSNKQYFIAYLIMSYLKVKLLIFMLRLADDRNYLTFGGIMVTSRQNVTLVSVLAAMTALILFVVDGKCVQIF